jgi:hypothetical protein
VLEHHVVNHAGKEFARITTVIANPTSGERRPGMAGTMSIDRAWRSLKQELPGSGLSCKTIAGRRQMELAVRAAHWKRMISTADRWGPFCSAVQTWVEQEQAVASQRAAVTDSTSQPARAEDDVQDEQVRRTRLRTKTAAADTAYDLVVSETDVGQEVRLEGLVESAAGGFADQCCHIDSASRVRCTAEMFGSCPRCLVSLCVFHVAMPGGQDHHQSRCCEHNGEVGWASAFCPCAECKLARH